MGISDYYARLLKNILIIRKCVVFSGKRLTLKCVFLIKHPSTEGFCRGLASSFCAGVNDCSWSSAGAGGTGRQRWEAALGSPPHGKLNIKAKAEQVSNKKQGKLMCLANSSTKRLWPLPELSC